MKTNMASEKKKFKIIVVGDGSIGKSCLTYRYCEGHRLDNPVTTVGVDFRVKVIDVAGERITLQIWDTAGQERFHGSVINYYFRNADAVVFMYDITTHESLMKIKYWIDICKHHNLTPDTVPCIMIGNKCDKKDNRAVSLKTAMMFADAYDIPLFETSAVADSESDNINSIFDTLVHLLVKRKTFKKSDEDTVKLEDSQESNKVKGGCCS